MILLANSTACTVNSKDPIRPNVSGHDFSPCEAPRNAAQEFASSIENAGEPSFERTVHSGPTACGSGKRLIEKHARKKRRPWRAMCIGMEDDMGRIVAAALTNHSIANGSQAPRGLTRSPSPCPLGSVMVRRIAPGATHQRSPLPWSWRLA